MTLYTKALRAKCAKYVKENALSESVEDKARAEVQFWSQNVYPGSRAIEVVIETDEKGRKSIMIGLIRFCPDASKTSSLFYVFQCIRNGRGCNAYILVFKQSPNFAIAVNNHSEHQRYDDRDYNSIGQLVFLTRLAKICDQLDKDFLDVESDDVPDPAVMDESDFLFFAECKELAQNILSYEDTKADHHLVYAFFHSSIKKNSSIEEKINRLKRIGESSTIFENRVGCYAQLNVLNALNEKCGGLNFQGIELFSGLRRDIGEYLEAIFIPCFQNDFGDRACQLCNLQQPKSVPRPKKREDVINEQKGAAFLLCSGVVFGKWKKVDLTAKHETLQSDAKSTHATMQMTKLQIFAAYTNVKAENEDLKALVSELKQKLQIDSKFPAGGYTDFYEEAEFFEENQLDAEVDVEPSKFDQRIGGPM